MNPFSEKKNLLDSLIKIVRQESVPDEPIDVAQPWECPSCGGDMTRGELAEHFYVCPLCGHHEMMPAKERINMIADEGSFREMQRSLAGTDPLEFPGYKEKIEEAREKTGLKEAVVTGTARIEGIKIMLCVMDGRFMMASMGMAVGEKITRAIEYATKRKLPIVIFCASGGARMQEGIMSLMQMAKTSAAVARHDEAGLLYISVLTNPTTGGVTASFASLGDIVLAEPEALIGFAGPRVIEQTIGEKLPEGFQRAEFQREHGFCDAVTDRFDMRRRLALLLKLHERG